MKKDEAATRVRYLRWRDGRPRWEPGPTLRAKGYRGFDLKDDDGNWLTRSAAVAALSAAENLPQNLKARVPELRTPKHLARRYYAADDAALAEILAAGKFWKLSRLERLGTGEFIYVFGMAQRWAKIGYTTNPALRMRDLSAASPLRLDVLLIAPGTHTDEAMLHDRFSEYRLKNEWFRLAGELAIWLEHTAPASITQSDVRLRAFTSVPKGAC